MIKVKDKISVIVPTYNNGGYISRCIKSILAQNYKAIELIIIDDGSTDNTKEIVESFQDGRIRYVRQKNSGVSVARNKGISVSTGKYVMFVDADDEIERGTIKKVANCIKRNEVDVVRFSYKEKYAVGEKVISMVDLAGKEVTFSKKNKQSAADIFLGEKAYLKCLVMTLLLKKDFLVKKNICFNQRLYMMEDVVFYTDLFIANAKFYFLDEPLYVYYQNANSVTHDSKKIERIIIGILAANKEIIKRFPKERITINNKHFQIIMSLLTRNYEVNKKILHLESLKKLAAKTNFKRGIISKILRYSLVKERKTLFALIIKIKAYKNRLFNKEKNYI